MSTVAPGRVVDALEARGLAPRGAGVAAWTSRCPAHDDGNASLSVGTGRDGRVLLCCHAGCDAVDVLDALGLDWPDLFDGDPPKPYSTAGLRRAGATMEPDGRLRVGAVRYMPGAGEGERKSQADHGTKRAIHPDPATVEGDELWIVEGEGDLLTASTLDLPAVAMPGASFKLDGDTAATLAAGRQRVVVIADSDTPGRTAAARWAAALAEHCPDVRILDLHPNRDDGADLSTFAADAHTDQDRACATKLLRQWTAETAIKVTPTAAATAAPLRTRTGREILASTPEQPPWICEGYLARGAVTLLSGSPKAGKSTLALAVAAAVAQSETTFLGRAVDPGPVLYVTEEDDGTLRPKLFDEGHFATRTDLWPAPAWPALLAGLTAAAREHRAHLVVIDTFAHWAQLAGDQEKDAGHVQRALAHVHGLARAGCAVLLVHHTRKGGGEHGEAVRGSGALLGAVDASIELERPKDAPHGRRQLVYLGRWENAAPVLLIDRHADGSYHAAGQAQDRQQAADGQAPALLLDAVRAHPGLTRDELYDVVRTDGCNVRNDVLGRALGQLVNTGAVRREGEGKKGDPYRHHEALPDGVPEPIPALPQPGKGIPTAPTSFPFPTQSPVGDRGRETNGTTQNPLFITHADVDQSAA